MHSLVCHLRYRVFFFQAEYGIRDAQESRGLGDVYKRQESSGTACGTSVSPGAWRRATSRRSGGASARWSTACLLYTSDAADDLLCVDLGGRRIIKKKKTDI